MVNTSTENGTLNDTIHLGVYEMNESNLGLISSWENITDLRIDVGYDQEGQYFVINILHNIYDDE